MVRFRCGRDDLRLNGWSIAFFAFRRAALPGEIRWRVCLEWHVSSYPFSITRFWRFWPAWRDEPTALAEFNRTMRSQS